MKIQKLLAATLAGIMGFTNVIPADSLRTAATAQASATELSDPISDMTIESTNSFGSLLASELTEKQAEQLANNGCNIFSVEMDGTMATVSYQTVVDCTLVVGIYDESGTTLYATGTAEVSPDERETVVTIETDEMPQYFYVKGYLADSYILSPLCTVYKCPNYTQEMQEFFAKTVDDFDEQKVINFDDDRTNNFAVYDENTIIIPENEGYNIVTSADDENSVYVIENADENVLSLQNGDIFSYTYGDNELLIIKIDTISIDGTTVTITGAETDMDEVFEFVRIETDGDTTNAEASANPEIEDTETENVAAARVDISSQIPFSKSKEKSDASSTAELTFEFEGEYKKDSKTPQDTGKKDNNNNSIKRQVSALSCDVKISGNVSLKVAFQTKVYISWKRSYAEMKLSYEGKISLNASANVKFNVDFEKLTVKLLGGAVTLEITPQLILELQAEVTFNGNWWGSVGGKATLERKKINVENISENPQHSFESKMDGSIYIGLNLKPKIIIFNEKIASANMEGELGIKLTQKRDFSYDSTVDYSQEKQLHGCTWCYDGDIYLCGKLLFNINFLGHQSDDKYLIGSKDGNAEKKIADYYWSVDRGEFAMTECPHDLYRVTISVTDKNENPISNSTITFSQDIIVRLSSSPLKDVTGSVIAGDDGTIIVFCPLGTVKFDVSAPGHQTVTKKFCLFKNEDGSVTPHPYTTEIVTVSLGEPTNLADGYTAHTKKTYNGHTYQLFDHTKLLTWTEAKAFCEEIGGHLVTIGDADEQQVIEDMFSEATLDGYWMGLYLDGDQWQWIDGTEFSYTNWDYDQMNEIAKPDNNSGDEQYGSIYAVTKEYPTWIQNAYKWDDTADDEECVNGIICEWDKLNTATVSLNTSVSVKATNGETPQTSLTDLEPNTIYNYYLLSTTDTDTLLTPANIQYITQFISSSSGTADIDIGETPITEDAVMLVVPAETTKPTYGDVDGNGNISISDVVALNKYLLGDETAISGSGKANADVDANGMIESLDSLNILKCCVKLIDEDAFPLA